MVFEYSDYRDFLRVKIEQNKDVKGYRARLAKEAGCQPSVISQVINERANLSYEQAARLASFWDMSSKEANYFLLLVGEERAGNNELKRYLNDQVKEIKIATQDLDTRFNEKKLDSITEQSLYYSNWYNAAVHVLLSIKGFNTPEKIATKLNMSNQEALNILLTLKKLGLATNKSERWAQTESYLHLPKESPMTTINHMNWRHKAVNNIQKKSSDDLFFSSAFSCSKDGFEKIKASFLSAVDETRDIVKDQAQEELYGLNVDLYRL